DNVIGAGVHFRFEAIHLDQSIRRGRMSLGKASDSNPETTAIGMRAGLVEAADEFYQIDCVLKRGTRFVVSNSGRPVATEGKNVSNRRFGGSAANRFDFVFVVADAGEVWNRIQLCCVLNTLNKVVG